ncbi:MAG: hypothetical protein HY814_13610 [Candidatus Riflebacteria bacterium]|nr:hypothetical protein [Candidatus Riflebacteria bacterium]
MSRVLHFPRQSWATRLWWSFWRWLRPVERGRPRLDDRLESALLPSQGRPRTPQQLLTNQRRVVDELRRLNQLLARTNSDLGIASRRPGRRSGGAVLDLVSRLRPKPES